MNISEVENRNESYLASITHLRNALSEAERFPEYPEHNVVAIEIREALDGITTRLLSYAKTTDKNMMIRIHQLQVVEGGA